MKNKTNLTRHLFFFSLIFVILLALLFIIPIRTEVFACGTDIDCGDPNLECTGSSCDPDTGLCSGGNCTGIGNTQPNQKECFYCASGFCQRTQIADTDPCNTDCAGCQGGSEISSPPPNPSPLPAPGNPASACSADGLRSTISFDQVSGASGYLLRVNNDAANSPSWMDYTDYNVGTSSDSICSGGRCNFTTGNLGNMWNSYCPVLGRNCVLSDFTNGPTSITPGAPYSWSVQGMQPGESYPFSGAFAGGGFTCNIPTCQISGARCGAVTSNSITIEGISMTDNSWGANGIFIEGAGSFPGTYVPGTPPASTYTVSGLTQGTSYTYDVGCYKDIGGGSRSVIGRSGQFTCTTSATTLSLGPLTVVNDALRGGVIGKKYGTSGLRTDAGEGGTNASNFFNALKITQNVQFSGNAALSGMAFVHESASPTNLSTLISGARMGRGFIALYANRDVAHGEGPAVGSCGAQFCQGNYYVFFDDGDFVTNDWHGPYQEDQTFFKPNEISIRVIGGKEAAPQFSVHLYKNLGSRTWKTYGYFMNNSSFAETALYRPACGDGTAGLPTTACY